MNQKERVYHVSEEAGIQIFEPRPSPSFFESIQDNVVFAISENMLHNYLLPRDCPRVTFYAGPTTTEEDKHQFMQSSAQFVVAIEWKWVQTVQQTTLYCYELPADTFQLLDACAGYYISYQIITPISVQSITDVMNELHMRNIELRIVPNLWKLADAVRKSSLSFSLIRMRNAEQ